MVGFYLSQVEVAGCLSWWHVARAHIAGCLCLKYRSGQSRAGSLARHDLAGRIRSNRWAVFRTGVRSIVGPGPLHSRSVLDREV